MITMTCHLLSQGAPGNVKRIELILPDSWHSFFTFRQEIWEGVRLGEDCDVKNWKEYARKVVKLPASWYFKFASAKRFIIEKTLPGMVVVTGDPNYYANLGEIKSVMKRRKWFVDCTPELLPRGVVLNPTKVTASHFGEKWAEDNIVTEKIVCIANTLKRRSNVLRCHSGCDVLRVLPDASYRKFLILMNVYNMRPHSVWREAIPVTTPCCGRPSVIPTPTASRPHLPPERVKFDRSKLGALVSARPCFVGWFTSH
ncbi:hypothetical protein PR048_009375 [Dryococelus australis]|uniref:Uncharacterized protein n=1 Tax=Dryococelus australis TaxID=614101 RepID=A0ABQ9I0S9_9NEOP|nr:hypothetical protein PR048_009375 [Dryococelus australis]